MVILKNKVMEIPPGGSLGASVGVQPKFLHPCHLKMQKVRISFLTASRV